MTTQATDTAQDIYEDESVAEAMQALRYAPGCAAEEAKARFYRVLAWLRRSGYTRGVEMMTTLATGETFHNHTAFGLLSLVLAGEPIANVELFKAGGRATLAMPVAACRRCNGTGRSMEVHPERGTVSERLCPACHRDSGMGIVLEAR